MPAEFPSRLARVTMTTVVRDHVAHGENSGKKGVEGRRDGARARAAGERECHGRSNRCRVSPYIPLVSLPFIERPLRAERGQRINGYRDNGG